MDFNKLYFVMPQNTQNSKLFIYKQKHIQLIRCHILDWKSFAFYHDMHENVQDAKQFDFIKQ